MKNSSVSFSEKVDCFSGKVDFIPGKVDFVLERLTFERKGEGLTVRGER